MTASTTDTFDLEGIREDLIDVIYNIDPTNTPFFSNAPVVDATNVNHEWQTDSLSSAADNAAIQGADATLAPSSPTTRLGNYTRISTKTATVAGTVEATDRAGRAREMAYQMNKRAKELKRDNEIALVGLNQAKVAPTASLAGKNASYQSWVATNSNFDEVNGADPTGDGTDSRGDGIADRQFDETMLSDVIGQIFESGGNPDIIMAGTYNKQKISQFTGNATSTFHENPDMTVVNAVDVYKSDFGTFAVVANRFQRARDVLVYQRDMWKVAYLRPFTQFELARTGDAENRQLLVEFTLEACNEASSGIIADLASAPAP